jgi:hypothetical protein
LVDQEKMEGPKPHVQKEQAWNGFYLTADVTRLGGKKCKGWQMHRHHFKLIFMNLRKLSIKMCALLEGYKFVSFPLSSPFLQYQLQSARLLISV